MIYVLLIEYIYNYLYISLLNLFCVSQLISLAWEDNREINESRFICLFSRPIKVKGFAMQATIHDHKHMTAHRSEFNLSVTAWQETAGK